MSNFAVEQMIFLGTSSLCDATKIEKLLNKIYIKFRLFNTRMILSDPAQFEKSLQKSEISSVTLIRYTFESYSLFRDTRSTNHVKSKPISDHLTFDTIASTWVHILRMLGSYCETGNVDNSQCLSTVS